MSISPRRSALYMPASNERALEKARSLPTDMIIIDLEDSVAPEAKGKARQTASAAILGGGYGNREVLLRLNAPCTEFWEADVALLSTCQPDGVLVPKINSADDVAAIQKAICAAASDHQPGLWLMMETPASVLNALSIAQMASECPNLQGFVIGTNDLVKDAGIDPGHNRETLVPWLMLTVAAAKAAGLSLLDGVYNDFRDTDGFAAECAQGRRMGMNGKTLIHPNQIEACNRIFSPTDEEKQAAREIVDAFENKEVAGKGVISVNGKMVERLHLEIALATLDRAEAISSAERP